MTEYIPYTSVDVNQACTGASGNYVALLYPGSDMPGFGRSNQVDIGPEGEIPDLLIAINDDAPLLAAVSIARICRRRNHAEPATRPQFAGKQIELVGNNVFIPNQVINIRINWSTAARSTDNQGFSTAWTAGGHMELENVLFMPDAELDTNQRYGEIIRARGSKALYVARNQNVKVHHASKTFDR